MSPETINLVIAVIGGVIVLVIREFAENPRRQRTRRELDDAKAQAQQAQNKVAVVEANAGLLETRFRSAAEEIAQRAYSEQQKQLDKLTTTVTDLQTKLEASEGENDKLRTRLQAKEEALLALEQKIQELEKRVEKITSERNTATIELEQARNRETELERRLATVERENTAMREEVIRLKAELEAYKTIVVPFFDRLSLVINAAPPEPPASLKAAA